MDPGCFSPRDTQPTASKNRPGLRSLGHWRKGWALPGYVWPPEKKLMAERGCGPELGATWPRCPAARPAQKNQSKGGRNWISAPGRLGWLRLGRRGALDPSPPLPGADARPCPRQGHRDSFPFQPGKPPPCPHPTLCCQTWKRDLEPPRAAFPPKFLQLFQLARAGAPRPPWPGAPTDTCPRMGKMAQQPTAHPTASPSLASACSAYVLGPRGVSPDPRTEPPSENLSSVTSVLEAGSGGPIRSSGRNVSLLAKS